jgi:hypothetical protein
MSHIFAENPDVCSNSETVILYCKGCKGLLICESLFDQWLFPCDSVSSVVLQFLFFSRKEREELTVNERFYAQ